MSNQHDPVKSSKILNPLAKRIAPLLASITSQQPMASWIRKLEIFCAILQGKGSGAGWDIDGEIKAARRFIKSDNPILIDVGANVGKWSSDMQKEYKGKAKIYMIEPSEYCCGKIRELKLPNSKIIQCAAGEKYEKKDLFFPVQGSGLSSLHQRGDSFVNHKSFDTEEVIVRSIDEIAEEEGIDRIDFLKIDTEGHDFFVLKGFKKLISNKKLAAFSFEFGSGNINSRVFFRDIWHYIQENDLKLYRILPGGKTIIINNYYEDIEYYRSVSNYICTI